MNNNELLEEIKSYPYYLIEDLLNDQHHLEKYINDKCMDCKNHSCIIFDNRDVHICDDKWSEMNVGRHVFYCETRDICQEMHGFKKK